MNTDKKHKILNIHTAILFVTAIICLVFKLPDIVVVILLGGCVVAGLVLSFKYKIPIYGKKIINKENLEKEYDSVSIITNILIIIILLYSIFKYLS